MKRKSKKINDEQISSWEQTATAFEDPSISLEMMKASRVLSVSERRRVYGPSKTKQISVRLPEEDLEAIKEIAQTNHRPYQQLVVIAVQQYLDQLVERIRLATKNRGEEIA